MCKYHILSRNEKGFIRYCYCCQSYSLYYGNILMNFNRTGFQQFKDNVTKCYAENIRNSADRKRRDIFFNTKVEGLQFVFSTEEVGDLLSLIQTADIESSMILHSK